MSDDAKPRSPQPRTIRVAVIDDDPIVRRHFESVIAARTDFILMPGAGSLTEAQSILTNVPDVVLLDLGLPDGSGLSLIDTLKADDVTVLVVTVFEDQDSVMQALGAGADGYLIKDALPGEVIAAIQSALDGGTPISAAAATHLLARLRPAMSAEDQNRLKTQDAGVALTPREIQLLELFARGLTYQETGDVLGISRHTVNDHVKTIYRKLGVKSRAEAIYEAMQDNLIKPPGV